MKFDLTHDEILIFNPISNPIFHQYSDASEFENLLIQTYGIEELFIEKTRALLERTRPRDLFDVVEIWKREERALRNVMSLNSHFRKKCAFKNVDIQNLSSSKIEGCRIGWKDQLEHQLSSLPNFENYFEFFRNTIFPVFEKNIS
ncbi:MAG TPA: nucleotidyl transferase AbiEii/AbiGii toxin family protein [Alphaproteobacteria bacterium]|nr:nucleotidyl transferase AbiEii/AbiGii toxin family protein [Alphaproteobacteria bacterium]HQS93368.1 nucleotidyl transferase AbiEii/AbiGii toxin family protein [Alphaproteobacteria bacterium]